MSLHHYCVYRVALQTRAAGEAPLYKREARSSVVQLLSLGFVSESRKDAKFLGSTLATARRFQNKGAGVITLALRLVVLWSSFCSQSTAVKDFTMSVGQNLAPAGRGSLEADPQSTKAADVLVVQYIALALASRARFEAFASHLENNREKLQPIVLSILLYFPETVEPARYATLIKFAQQKLDKELAKPPAEGLADLEEIAHLDLSELVVRRAMHRLTLQSISFPEFLHRRIRQIDNNSGSIANEILLLKTFPDQCVDWRRGIIRPSASLRSCGIYLSIDELEQLSVQAAVDILFDPAHNDDLEELLQDGFIPWSAYQKTSHAFCTSIRDRLRTSASISLRTILRILSSAIQSDLDHQSKALLASAAIAACYLQPAVSNGSDHCAEMQTIVAILTNCFKDESEHQNAHQDSYASYTHFRSNLLQDESNSSSLLDPNIQNIAFLKGLVDACAIFGSMQRSVEVLLGPVDNQTRELNRLLLVARSDAEFSQLRRSLLDQSFFSSLTNEALEYTLLKSLLVTKKTGLAKRIYVAASPRPLKSDQVERAIIDAFDELFDNARSLTRAELSQAFEVLALIHPKHSNTKIRQAQVLVDSLIELSAYKGAQHFLPIQIRRSNSEELSSLFSQILQERGNYKKHFRLFGLYQNICLSLQQSTEELAFREIVVNAALASDDLKFSLDYVEDIVAATEDETDDTTEERTTNNNWSLIYQACRYPADSVTIVRQQLDLMSKAIAACPADKLHQLLALFCRLEVSIESLESALQDFDPWDMPQEDYSSLDRSQENPQLRHQDSSASTSSVRAAKIDMPQWRLFEAAQAATQAARQYLPAANQEGQEPGGRVRKRDQLVGLVGSGVGVVESRFTTGLGWIRKSTRSFTVHQHGANGV